MQVPSSIVTDIASSTAAVSNGAMPLLVILFGLGVAFYIIRHLVSLLPKG